MSFIDAFSKYTSIYPLKSKSEVQQAFKTSKAQVQLQFNSKIVSFESDNGSEFLILQNYFKACGITSRRSCPTPQLKMISLNENIDT